MTTINAYLNFNGRCREALTFYQECLGGELYLQKIAGSPMALHMPSRAGEKILHGSLTLNGKVLLLASDMIGTDLIPGNQITLCLNCGNEHDMQESFDKLTREGTIKHHLHQSLWGTTFGELTDRFGMTWMFNYSRMLNHPVTPDDPEDEPDLPSLPQ